MARQFGEGIPIYVQFNMHTSEQAKLRPQQNIWLPSKSYSGIVSYVSTGRLAGGGGSDIMYEECMKQHMERSSSHVSHIQSA